MFVVFSLDDVRQFENRWDVLILLLVRRCETHAQDS